MKPRTKGTGGEGAYIYAILESFLSKLSRANSNEAGLIGGQVVILHSGLEGQTL